MYVGEFDANRDGTQLNAFEFVRWLRTLGYDGVWPWSLNTLRGISTAASADSSRDPVSEQMGLAPIAKLRAALTAPEPFPDFGKRRDLTAVGLGKMSQDRWGTWLRDGQTVLNTYGSYSPARTEEHEAALMKDDQRLMGVIRDKEVELAEPSGAVARCFIENEPQVKSHQSDLERETSLLNEQATNLAQTRNQIRSLLESEKTIDPELDALHQQETRQEGWVKDYQGKVESAKGEVARAMNALDVCRTYKEQSEKTKRDAELGRSQIHEELANSVRQRYRSNVYVDFWKSELDWAKGIGFFGLSPVSP
jgi:hypothetical protein